MKEKITFLAAVICCGFHLSLHSQETGAAVEFGFGRTAFEDNATFTGPLNRDLANFYRFGISVRRTPAHKQFYFATGLIYNMRREGYQQLLQVPLEFHYSTGNRLLLLLGGGVYSRYLLSYDNKAELGGASDVNRWQTGCSLDAGLGFPLTDRLQLDVVFKQNFDLTNLYTINYRGSSDYRAFDGFFNFSVHYKLLPAKPKQEE